MKVISLSERTQDKIRELFSPEHCATVTHILETECGNNLPFLEHADGNMLERYQLAALKLSRGTLEGLREAVDLAKVDWRDLLVAADSPDPPVKRSDWRFWRPKSRR